MSTDLRNVKKQTLANGLTVISERIPYLRSAAMGIWVVAGSRKEAADVNGISHFIEHMVFKGTENRTAEQIAREVDGVGGYLDAFTTKEVICFSVKVLDKHLPLAFDVLSDLVLHPLFAEADIHKERGVILEEIKMESDNPEYLVHETLTQHFWPDHPIGRPILGTKDTVLRFAQPAVRDYFRRWFVPNHMVVSAAGNLHHEQVVELFEHAFGQLRPGPGGNGDRPPAPHAPLLSRTRRELEQMHICLGVPSYPLAHERRFTCALLHTMLGGGMSSRLFQKIREREGLAYAVFSDIHAYTDTGLLTVYAGTARETAERVVRMILQEFCELKNRPVAADELRRAQDHLKGALLLSLESSTARMSNWARQHIYFGEFHSLDQIAAGIDAVTAEEIQSVAQEFFRPELIGVSVLGNLDGLKLTREQLQC
ncbi:MAG: insulinase family protein [Acidobacteria bacterium]|nr:insulinase family protein [Acidobacteriota bacterium]